MKIVTNDVGSCEYLTAGKEYTVLFEHSTGFNEREQRVCDILSDTGQRITILMKDCPHTGSDWEVSGLDELAKLGQEMQPEIYDMVEKPKHYQLLPGVEVKDVREAILNKLPEGVPYTQVDDWSRCWEYVTRAWDKNGLEDFKKARVYLNWLIEKMEGEE